MKDFLDFIKDYLLDSKKSIGRRLGNFVMACSLVLIFDLSFNVSHSFYESNRLNKLAQLEKLYVGYKDDPRTIAELDKVKNNTLNSRHYSSLLKSLLFSIFSGPENIAQSTTEEQNTAHKTKPKLSILLTALSSSTLFLLLAILAYTAPIWSKNLSFSNIRESFTVGFFCTIAVAVCTIISLNVPVIFKSAPWANYILYVVIQVLFISYMTYIGTRYSQKKRELENYTKP